MGKTRGTWGQPASFIRFPAAHVSHPLPVIKPYHPKILALLPFLLSLCALRVPLLVQRPFEKYSSPTSYHRLQKIPRSHGADSFPEACLFVGDTSENVFDESTDPEHLSLLVYHRVYRFIPGYMRDASQVRRTCQIYLCGVSRSAFSPLFCESFLCTTHSNPNKSSVIF